jgi:hypothetical protein
MAQSKTEPASIPASLLGPKLGQVPAAAEPASPVCYAGEMGPAYGGYFTDAELVALLELLLEGERAGERATALLAAECPSNEAAILLASIKRDETRFAGMLAWLIGKLGARPSDKIGAFYDKIVAVEGFGARVKLLNRGQAWVVRKLDESLPRVRDDRIHAALKGMRGAHEVNVARCDALIATIA